MKKSVLAALLVAGITMAFTPKARAADAKTLTGEGKCAKCALHEADKCANVIQTKEDGKTVTYYLAQNKISKSFHENLCHAPEKVTATGTVKEVEGKLQMTPTKMELAAE